ncbi:MAG: flagellar protein FlbB [Alphaproteobacteria bacterium]|nr:flagellar protein FlbB [Alphaproteobacteria bacterium]
MNILMRFRLLPLLVFVAMLAFSIRLADIVVGVSRLSGEAHAQDHEAPAEEHAAEESASHEEGMQGGATDENGDKTEGGTEKSKGLVFEDESAKAPEWRDASDSDLDMTSVRMDLMDDLAARRKKLEEDESNLKVREAMLTAAGQELDRKFQELQKLKQEIEGLLEKQSDEENAKIQSLVKVYEGMKPKDAARIFDTLDIDVLIQVVSKMSERKLSPVLASMNPERARTITIMLAEQKKLPTLPQVN